jgi:Asp-tRNA(Asn)/Glu-tRNA(Gln) amidotransferase A subunit family amidase
MACPSPSRRRSTSRGLHATSSYPPLKDDVAREDASLVARLRAAGAVILGKTDLPELCIGKKWDDAKLLGVAKAAGWREADGRMHCRQR